MLVFGITASFDLFERGADSGIHLVKESSPECIAKIGVIKVSDMSPDTIVTETTFGEKTVDMRIPLEVTTKSVQDHDIAGSKVFGFIEFAEHTGDDTADGMKKTVQQRSILQEEITKVLINSENTVAVRDIHKLERHAQSAVHGVFIATRRTEAAVTAKRDKL